MQKKQDLKALEVSGRITLASVDFISTLIKASLYIFLFSAKNLTVA